jgi:nucleotide-binding universal stress UspA family protein
LKRARQKFKVASNASRLQFKRVLVTIDGSKNAARAARVAVELARRYRAELLVLHAIHMPSYLFAQASGVGMPQAAWEDYNLRAKTEAEGWIDEVVSLAKSRRLIVRGQVLDAQPSVVEAITEYAIAKRVDLIVMGTRGLSAFKKLLLGSTSTGVTNHAHCSVLLVR